MGNKASNPEGYGEWVWDTECEHPRYCKRVTEVRWIRVPMASGFLTGTAEVGRWVVGIGTLGVSAVFNGGIKDLSHECIEIIYTCDRCPSGNWKRFTAEILGKNKKGGGGTRFVCGYYSVKKDARHTYKPTSMTLDYVERKYNEMGEGYDFVFNNCSHWSSCLWNKL